MLKNENMYEYESIHIIFVLIATAIMERTGGSFKANSTQTNDAWILTNAHYIITCINLVLSCVYTFKPAHEAFVLIPSASSDGSDEPANLRGLAKVLERTAA